MHCSEPAHTYELRHPTRILAWLEAGPLSRSHASRIRRGTLEARHVKAALSAMVVPIAAGKIVKEAKIITDPHVLVTFFRDWVFR